MRLERLRIPAFGPFTDLDLEFPRKEHDFHLIYGPNEAGKSSLLRAIRDLLFGIHGQSSDNFLHDYKSLRLSAEIVNQTGQRLFFQRRKGNKNTLLDSEDQPLSDQALLPFLGSVDLHYFSTMFGLGTQELREGAKQLLQGEGEVGQALFTANLGGTPIHRIMGSILTEAEKLYKGRATTHVSIRPAVKSYKDQLKSIREALVNPDTWDRLDKAIKEGDSRKRGIESQLSEVETRLNWITRCEDAWPTLGKLHHEQEHIQSLPHLPALPADFIQRARTAQGEWTEIRTQGEAQTRHLNALKESFENISSKLDVHDKAKEIEVIHQNLGVYRNRKEAWAELQAKLKSLEQTLQAGMKNLGLQGETQAIESIRISSDHCLALEESADALEQARADLDKVRAKTIESQQGLAELENELTAEEEPDLNPIREALATAANATDAAANLPRLEIDRDEWRNKVAHLHALVLGAPSDWEETARMPIPTSAGIREFRMRFDDIRREIQSEQKRILDEKQTVEANRKELVRLQRRGELPSVEALNQAREHRDEGWQKVLRAWKDKKSPEEWVPGVPLEEAYPDSVKKADQLADQLRLQAEEVAQAEEKRQQIEACEKRISHAEDSLRDWNRRLDETRSEWEQRWKDSAITPGSPGEMEAWRETWIDFRDAYDRLKSAETTLQARTRQVEAAIQVLSQVVQTTGAPCFATLYESARKKVADGEEQIGARKKIRKDLNNLQTRMNGLKQDWELQTLRLREAEQTWQKHGRIAGLPDGMTPKAGLKLLEERKRLVVEWDKWKADSAEAETLKETIAQYERSVTGLARVMGVEVREVELMESEMWQALQTAREMRTRRDQLKSQIEEGKTRLTELRQREAQAKSVLDALLSQAGVSDQTELEPFLSNLEKRIQIQASIDNFRLTLSGLARGEPLEVFTGRVREENPDELQPKKDQLQQRQSELKNELQSALDELAELKRQRQEMEKAGDQAAGYRQGAESTAAVIRQDAARYLRLRLAAHYLQNQVERFREENQGPLLEKSGEVFNRITLGSFQGLTAEYNDQDVPLLVGKRPDGSTVKVDGMSDGTRDQLYLSLRLAALERYLDDHEPMPLILDDLLITFDDQRASAILPELSRLARKTQVFLFTHHRHLMELVKDQDEPVKVVYLSSNESNPQ